MGLMRLLLGFIIVAGIVFYLMKMQAEHGSDTGATVDNLAKSAQQTAHAASQRERSAVEDMAANEGANLGDPAQQGSQGD